jgi:hypothetical protein
MPSQVCIYCWRTGDDVAFSEEHIIPDCVFGRLVLPDHVCADCNRWLGAKVDHQVLKVPDVLRAHEALGYTDRHQELLRHNYRVKLVTESGNEFIARVKGAKPELLTQRLDDGTLIYPESTADADLRKTLERTGRRRAMSDEESESEINRICIWAKEAAPGDEIDSPLFGSKFRKESRALHSQVEPVAKGEATRVVAKIAYEFMFLVGYRRLYDIENLHKNLISAIGGQEDTQGLIIYRMKPKIPKPEPFHYIRLYSHAGYPRVDVGFFGSIAYMMFATSPLPQDFFESIGKRFDCPQIVGVQYEEGTNGDFQTMWALESNGKTKLLNAG